MKIQSLSVMPPSRGCINKCPFCVAGMHQSPYRNNFDNNLPFYDLYMKDYVRRLEFARDNGCNTVMITGDCEPQQDRGFLTTFGMLNNSLERPFRNIEIQTTGIMIDENYLRFMRNHVGISTISLSVSSLASAVNALMLGMPQGHGVNLSNFASLIKKYDFNLRLSINLTNAFSVDKITPSVIIGIAKNSLLADQVTFRVLYADGQTEQAKWVTENSIDDASLHGIIDYIKSNGTPIGKLSYGAIKYSVGGMSVVLDDDCMSQQDHLDESEDYKYLILRENCKLYSRWDDPASLVF